ncbi:MAG: RbsD/FucU domain-containing protein [Eubacteriales bacterium]|nr:RbsD/FucU domain-containing protein [Eubacteriales bacterium]
MLKGIPKILSPELLMRLCEMGHGDRLVIADANFPSASTGKDKYVLRMDGHSGQAVLDAILELFPLDPYCDKAVYLMEKVPGDQVETPIWDSYRESLRQAGYQPEEVLDFYERYQFYEESAKAYLIIATGESALYANIMLQKGVI